MRMWLPYMRAKCWLYKLADQARLRVLYPSIQRIIQQLTLTLRHWYQASSRARVIYHRLSKVKMFPAFPSMGAASLLVKAQTLDCLRIDYTAKTIQSPSFKLWRKITPAQLLVISKHWSIPTIIPHHSNIKEVSARYKTIIITPATQRARSKTLEALSKSFLPSRHYWATEITL